MTQTLKRLSGLVVATGLLAGSAAAWHFRGVVPPATDALENSAPPASLVIVATDWDFGPVGQESVPLSHVFTLTNLGPAPVSLKRGVIGCGCMSVRCPESVAPGASAGVEVTIDPRKKTGSFVGPALIETTDAASPVIRFRVRADSVPALTVWPEVLQFLDVRPGGTPEQELTIVTRLDPGVAPAAAPRPECSSAALRCEHRESEAPEGQQDRPRRITHHYVAWLDATAWLAERPADLAIRLPGSDSSPDVQIPVRVTRRHHPVVVGQKSVVLYQNRPAAKTPVRFWAGDGRDLEIAEVRSSSPQVVVEVGQRKSTRIMEFTVSLAGATGSDHQPNSGRLDVQFTDGQLEPYRIEFLVIPQE
jgi:hypothetical protein